MVVCGDWLLTPERAAVHQPTGTAVVADLHLGFGQARSRAGDAVPAWGVEESLAALRRLVTRAPVRHLVVAGDLLEDGRCAGVLDAWYHGLRSLGLEWTGFVPGNHDRGLTGIPGEVTWYPHGMPLGEWQIVHGDGDLPPGPVVCGHFHPCLRWSNLSAPCFLTGPRRLILPAFSRDAAGVNVLGGEKWAHLSCRVLAGADVLDFGPVGGLAARLRRVPRAVGRRGVW